MGYKRAILSGSLLEVWSYEKNCRNEKGSRSQRGVRRMFEPTARTIFSIRRAKETFTRIVLSNLTGSQHPSFFTFTMLDDVSVEVGYEIFHSFFIRFRRRYGKELRYVCVPEFQKRGALHFHVLIWGMNEKDIKEERDSRRVQNIWGYGYVDCIQTDGSPKLGNYMAKYMRKAMHDARLLGKQAYRCSRNAMRPVFYKGEEAVDFVMEDVDISLATQRDYDTLWLGRANYKRLTIRPI